MWLDIFHTKYELASLRARLEIRLVGCGKIANSVFDQVRQRSYPVTGSPNLLGVLLLLWLSDEIRLGLFGFHAYRLTAVAMQWVALMRPTSRPSAS
jgi:hypothetical protein